MPKLSQHQSLFIHYKNWFRSGGWFPQLPLALAVALIGFFHLIPLIEHTVGWPIRLSLLDGVRRSLVDLTLLGIPQSAVGLLLLLMSLGLLWRSRIAWITSVVTLLIGLLLRVSAAADPLHWWWIGFDLALLLLLLPFYRHFDRHNITLATLFASASLIVFMGYAVFGTYHLGDQFHPPVTTLINALYFIVISISTVGFGDITPVTVESRLFLISVIVFGITVISTAVGTVLIPSILNRIEQLTTGRHKTVKRSGHYIIVGHSALATNTYHELILRGEQVTCILPSIPEHPRYRDVDIVPGDGSDIDILIKAGGEKAKAILALLGDDSENAFVILAAKELKSKVKTVAAVNDVKNLARIRRVHPYMVIAPQVLGGELLTMALTGEKVDSSTIMQRLLGQAERVAEKTAEDKEDK